jgi:restriction system protein
MRENSLFAMLLRSPWWYSLLIGAAIVGLALAVLRAQHAIYGISLAVPFFGLAAIAWYRQMGQPSARKVAKTVAWIRTARARELIRALTAAYAEDAYQVSPYKGNGADLQLEREGRLTLVSCKRVKAANTGVEPLHALVAAGEHKEASTLVFVTLGELSSDARAFANDNRIKILDGGDLTALIGRDLGKPG